MIFPYLNPNFHPHRMYNLTKIISHNYSVRVRFAPSPTGSLHLGGLRTALYNYLLAKKEGGKFILRIEDTDQKRLVSKAKEGLKEDLKWAGLKFDEGPEIGGSYGPYVQSERLSIYKKYADKLIEEDKAYHCFCKKERLETIKLKQKENGIITHYDGYCKTLTKEEVKDKLKNKEEHVIRFKNDYTDKTYSDIIYGPLKLQLVNNDIILMKADSYPTYHFANVVDDHLMKITHVLRGEEWLNSLPLHINLYSALNWESPQFYHLPLMLNNKGAKLSKRKDDVTIEDYKNKGYLPEALTNFIALLGWSPNTPNLEIMNLDKMIKEFSLDNINKSNPMVFNEKLNWFNKNHLKLKIENNNKRKQLVEELLPKIQLEFQEKIDKESSFRLKGEYVEKVLISMKDRLYFLNDLIQNCYFLFIIPNYQHQLNNLKSPLNQLINNSKNKEVLKTIILQLKESLKDQNIKEIDFTTFNSLINELNCNKNMAMKSTRILLTTESLGPPIFDIFHLLGPKEIINRLEVVEKLVITGKKEE
ncbi:glutamyl-tRNA synthetase [Neoconidiobolus thromboides FSU 785]|nr:glutamyl-tRNA synthetase [Neoconidiobolus thromboides FSU 785]